MKLRSCIVFVFIVLQVFVSFGQNTAHELLIKKVHILPMHKDTVLVSHDILISDGKIKQIAQDIPAENIKQINGNGAYLLPGLVDMHVHIWDQQELGLYLANGITTVRNMWGQPMHLRMKKKIAKGKLMSPMLFTASPKLSGRHDKGDDKIHVKNPRKGRKIVKSYKKAGYDYIKTYAGLPQDIFEAVIEQAIASDIDIVAHPSFEVPYDFHFQAPIKTIEHVEDIVQQPLNYKLDSIKLKEVVSLYATNEQAFCPTFTGYYNILEVLNKGKAVFKQPHYHYMNPLLKRVDSKAQYDRWTSALYHDKYVKDRIANQHSFHLYAVSELHKAGALMVCGTDAGIGFTTPGFSIHQELALLKEAGLSNYEVLKTATVNPTMVHSEMKDVGTIEPGKWANFVLTSENPLNDLGALENPELVILKGKQIDKEMMEKFKEKAYNRHNLVPTAVRYVEYLIVE